MAPMPGTATIANVELVSVGTWAASTGVTTVTRADLESMLAAATDGLVDHAPVKLGHVSDLNKGIGDGNPAYGWLVPKRIATNAAGNDTLYGDLVGMPSKLAAVAPTAYRRRSVEIAWNVKTTAGKTYPAALVGIALLGAAPPAVKGLADVLALYSAEPEVDHVAALELVEGLEDNTVAVAMLTAARVAGATVESIDAMAAAAGARDTADVPPPVQDPDHDGGNTHTGAAGTATKENTVALTDEEIRTALNLEADADVTAELTRIQAERTAAQNGQQATGGQQSGGTTDGAQGAGTGGSGTQQAAGDQSQGAGGEAAREPELATLSAATLSELQREAAWARNERRRRTLDDAVRAGRIAPAERGQLTSELSAGQTQAPGSWAAALERDEDGTTTLLGGLAPRFHTTELGADGAQNSSTADEALAQAFDDFERETFGVNRSSK